MISRDPEGYKKLLTYQKAQTLHQDTLELVSHFPKTKTYIDLADQMARSGRSGNKNIVEGWKRNTTKEYFDFLGFSIGAVEELKDDANDVVTGKYKELMGIKGVMGEMGNPLYPFDPLHPINPDQLNKIPFYPLNQNLPPAVKVYLEAKELNYLLYKLQQSLDIKMDKELTKPVNQRVGDYLQDQKKADRETKDYFKSLGLFHLENGRYVTTEEYEKLGRPPLFPE
jgi:four helix bundle protein